MDFFYFLVKDEKSGWDSVFHADYFDNVGFLYGILGALAIGVVCSLVFYFGLCNNKNNVKSATKTNWIIFLLVAGVAAYFYADFVLIGDPQTTTPGTTSFCENNNRMLIQLTQGQPQPVVQQFTNKYSEIRDNLQKGNDVAFAFDITTAVLAAIFYFLFSLIIKRFTIAGKAIPMLKP